MIRPLLSLVALCAILFFPSCDPNENVPCEDEKVEYKELRNVVDLEALSGPFNTGAVFENSLIEVTPYRYRDTLVYQLQGDTVYNHLAGDGSDYSACEITAVIDKASVRPHLEWVGVTDELVTAAIFEQHVEFQGKGSINDEHAVWGWHSDLGTGRQDNGKWIVRFDDGRKVVDGNIMSDQVAEALQPNKLYFWCVWSWDATGTRVVKSSREIPFFTTYSGSLMEVGVVNPLQVEGAWSILRATDMQTGANVTDVFPLQSLYFVKDDECNRSVEIGGASPVTETWSVSDQQVVVGPYVFREAVLNCQGLHATTRIDNKLYDVVFSQGFE